MRGLLKAWCTQFIIFVLLSSTAYSAVPVENEKPIDQAIQSDQSSQSNRAKNTSIITTGIPEGFDDLLEPQLTLVDVYYNGLAVGSTLASYTPQQIQFESPSELVGLLKAVKDKETLESLFRPPLDPNQQKVCYYAEQADCGVVSPQDVAVIFDESRMRVDVFMNPRFVKATLQTIDKYLPESKSGSAMINAFSLVASGGEEREEIYSAQLSSLYSHNNFRVISNIQSDNQNDTRLDQLSLVYEHRQFAYELGSFRTLAQASSFFQQRDFLGFRVQSTLASRTDLEQVSGTQIFVFLNERSRVEVFKDNDLIDSRVYPAGNIEINTEDFPQGAYNVELKITGDSGRSRSESHFYSKSLFLPPQEETLFFAEIGYPEADKTEDYPLAHDKSITRFGLLTRTTDFLGLSASLADSQNKQSIEFGSYWLGNQIELQSNHAYSSEKEFANYYLLSLRHPDFFLTASYRRTHSDVAVDDLAALRLLPEQQRQASLNLGVPMSDSMLNIFARTSESLGQEKTEALGLSWRKNLYRGSRMVLDWTVDASKESDDRRISSGLTLRFISSHYGMASQLRYQSREQQSAEQTHLDKSLQLSYRNFDSDFGRVNSSLQIEDNIESQSQTIQSEISNDYGYGRVLLDHVKRQNSEAGVSTAGQTGYSINSRFNIVAGGGELALGGDRRNTAGVMLDLESIQSPGLAFKVIVNGVERSQVAAGSQSFIALQPYEQYQLSLTPIGETLVEFDSKPREFTLYPGNVELLRWQVKEVKVVIMQLIDSVDKRFANARLQSQERYALTDDSGWVQMQVAEPGELIFIDRDRRQCKVTVTESELSETVNYLGVKHCFATELN